MISVFVKFFLQQIKLSNLYAVQSGLIEKLITNIAHIINWWDNSITSRRQRFLQFDEILKDNSENVWDIYD